MKNKRHKKNKNLPFLKIFIMFGFLLVLITIILIIIIPSLSIQSKTLIDNNWIGANETSDINRKPDIQIFNETPEFKEKIESTFEFLAECAPEDLIFADKYLSGIYESNGSHSGAEIAFNSTNILLTSNFTKYLPSNFSVSAQIFWYAGAIVHEARHSWQFQQSGLAKNWTSRTHEENTAMEIDALNVQIETFKKCIDDVPYEYREEAEIILEKFETLRDEMKKLKFDEQGNLLNSSN